MLTVICKQFIVATNYAPRKLVASDEFVAYANTLRAVSRWQYAKLRRLFFASNLYLNGCYEKCGKKMLKSLRNNFHYHPVAPILTVTLAVSLSPTLSHSQYLTSAPILPLYIHSSDSSNHLQHHTFAYP